MKFCVNCKHYLGQEIGPVGDWYEECRVPRQVEHDLVTGEPIRRELPKPRAERTSESRYACGRDAKFYEPL